MGQDLTLKEKFVQWMCPLVEENCGLIYFLHIDVAFDPKYKHIREDVHYKTLKRKMKNLMKMVNNDRSVGLMDIETELWDKI